MMHTLKIMADKAERDAIRAKTLLPVIIIEGESGSGKSFLMYYAVNAAAGLGYKIVSSCGVSSCIDVPFSAIASIVRRMFGLTLSETMFQREQIILDSLSDCEDPQLYLLNHMFHVHFPPPRVTTFDGEYRNQETVKLFKAIVRKFYDGHHAVIAIDNAYFMDVMSWHILRLLAEEQNILILLSLCLDFKEPTISASVLFLKAHTHITLEMSSGEYFGGLICWYLAVKAVHKDICRYLKNKTQGNAQLLQEVLLSPIIRESTHLIPFKDLDEEKVKEFFINEFKDESNEENEVACDLKPEVKLKEMIIPKNIMDTVKERLSLLNVQDRLLLKRAAVLGYDFDQHTLEACSSGMTSDEIVAAINNLQTCRILTSACTSQVVLEMVPDEPFEKLKSYGVCFCSKCSFKSTLTDDRNVQRRVGPYHRLKFRSDAFRQYILTYMTKDQLHTMHLEIAYALETKGLTCTSCKIKILEETQAEISITEMRCYPVQMDVNTCACLEKRPKIYSRISSIYHSIGLNIFATYFMKKAAQASNDLCYPIEALNEAELAQKLFPSKDADECKEESHFDKVTLRAAIRKTQAEAYLLLGETYDAASNALEALDIIGMNILYIHGVFSPKEFQRILRKFPLLHSEYITKIIGVLCRAYLAARKYKLALDLLKMEFVALSSYPIDFLQVLTHMVSLYECKYQLNPQKGILELEDNILRACHQRLRNFEIMLNYVEIKAVGATFVKLIETNILQVNLSKAESLAIEATAILKCVNEQTNVPHTQILLFEINFYHHQNYVDCYSLLISIRDAVKATGNMIFQAYYFSGVSSMILDDHTEEMDELDNDIKECNDFASGWSLNFAITLPRDLAYYISVKLALWCLTSRKFNKWSAAQKIFHQCQSVTNSLRDQQDKDTYWNIGASLLHIKLDIKLAAQDTEEDFHKEKATLLDASSVYLESRVL